MQGWYMENIYYSHLYINILTLILDTIWETGVILIWLSSLLHISIVLHECLSLFSIWGL